MRVVHSTADMRAARAGLDGKVGFVPTMGALHAGHVSLIERSVRECDTTVVSAYVNPTQFDNPEDLARYPVTLEEDTRLAREYGAALLFAPSYEDLYPDDFRYRVEENEFSRELCGAHRPGHFTGVLTVVMKLLNLVAPDRAYFGEKDFQQFQLIKGMAEAFFLPVEVVGCPTVREGDGLALSSRNVNLDPASREQAPLLFDLISSNDPDEAVARELEARGFDVDYVVSKAGRRFAAARLGGVRLIDNVPLNTGSER